jgi:hypothetical protein
MDFVVFVNSKKKIVEKIDLPNGKFIDFSQQNYNFDEMKDFIDYNFKILYSDGKIERATLLSVGFDDQLVPTFTYKTLDKSKEEEVHE